MTKKTTKTVRRISLGGRSLTYECTRKKVKNINIRIHTDGKLLVSAPFFISNEIIENALKTREAFILRAVDRINERKKQTGADFSFADGATLFFFGKEYTLSITNNGHSRVDGDRLILSLRKTEDTKNRKEAFKRFAQKELCAYATEVFEKTLPLFAPKVSSLPDLKLYTMRARWGSCRTKAAVITLNSRLAFYPKEYVDYVIMHEFTHLLHANHSKAFYQALALRMPDWETRRKALNSEPMKEYF